VDDLYARYADVEVGEMFRQFFRAMEKTALRTGLLVCGSVDVAMDIVRAEEAGFSDMAVKEREEELAWFAVSDDHFALRRIIGAVVESGV